MAPQYSAMTRFVHRGFSSLIFSFVLACGIALAQTNNVTVTGTITDPSGSLIPDCTIQIRDTSTGQVKDTKSDAKGEYSVLNLVPGTYEVKASAAGFGTVIKSNQVLLVGQNVAIDFSLSVATQAQTVTIEASSPVSVSTTDSMVARVIEPAELDNLPTISRSFTDLAALSPGVQVATSSSPAGAGVGAGNGISIGNAPGYQTGYLVDGVLDEVSGLGGAYINFAQDWIQEFSLVSQQAPAQYGGASGGFVNAITRSGGNKFHGRAYMFYQNAALNATPRFLPASAPTKPAYNLERVGGMLGGPIRRDKLFFFAGYEYFHDKNSIPVNVPAAFTGPASTSGVFPQSFLTNLIMAKLDWQKSDANHYMFRFNYEKDNNQNVGIGASGSSVHTLGNGTNQTPHDIQAEFRWGHTFSPTTYNELLGVFDYQITILQCPYAQAVGADPTGSTEGGNPTGYWAQITYPTAGVVTGCQANTGDASALPTQNAIDPVVTDIYSASRGPNELKFGAGVDIEETGSVKTRNNYNGQYSINGSKPFDPTNSATFPTSDFMLFGGGNYETNKVVGPMYSFFAQDSLKAAKNLTLNIGIRYDFNTMNTWLTNNYIIPAMKTNTVAELNPLNNDYSNIAPRFGFAWAPLKRSSSTVIRGGIGIFYDADKTAADYIYLIDGVVTANGGAINLNSTRPSLNPYCLGYVSCAPVAPATTATVPLQQQQWVNEVLAYALATYTIPTFNLGTYTFAGNTYNIPAPTFGPPLVAGGAGTGGLAPTTGGTNAVDPNLKNPGEMQASIGVGHDFTHSMTAAVDYVYVKGFQQIIIRNSNISQQGTLINPAFGSVSSSGNLGYFTDSSLRVKLSYRDHRGDSGQLAFTEARAYDNSYSSFGINSHTINATDPFNYGVDYGPSTGDAHHILNLAGVIEAPLGIEVDPIFYFTSALPYTATTTLTYAGCQSYYNQCYPPGYTKGSLRGANTVLLNARLAKVFKFGESKSLHVFVEGFNLPNHANYGTNYQANYNSATFGQPIALTTNLRQLQLGGRFDF
jgi:hypothetical protein